MVTRIGGKEVPDDLGSVYYGLTVLIGSPVTHLTIDSQRTASDCLIVAQGEIDLASAPELEQELGECLESASVIVDLSKVTFIDSTGLRVLLTAHDRATQTERTLRLVVAEGPVTKLLSITGVDGHLHTFDSVESARADA